MDDLMPVLMQLSQHMTYLQYWVPQVFGGQTSLGEVYDVVSGRQVEARMTERQEPVSLAAAGIPQETLQRVQHADGFMRYQVTATMSMLQPTSVHCSGWSPCNAVGSSTWRRP